MPLLDTGPTVYYRRIKDPTHPLAVSNGWVAEHRAVLYSKIGPGRHPCHWCQKQITWRRGRAVKDGITADHIDFNILNNDPGNIVASCHSCNVKRSRINVREEELYVVRPNGRKARAVWRTCYACGSSFLMDAGALKRKRAGAGRYCSKQCVWDRNKVISDAPA